MKHLNKTMKYVIVFLLSIIIIALNFGFINQTHSSDIIPNNESKTQFIEKNNTIYKSKESKDDGILETNLVLNETGYKSSITKLRITQEYNQHLLQFLLYMQVRSKSMLRFLSDVKPSKRSVSGE